MVGYVRKPFPGNRTHGLSVIPRLREFFFFYQSTVFLSTVY